MPFDNNQNKELLVSFSTGFTSTGSDSVNAERAAEVGMEAGWTVNDIEHGCQVKGKSPVITQKDSYGQREDST